MAVGAGLGLAEQHCLQPWQENLPSCWSGTSDTLLAQSGTSVVSKGAAPVLGWGLEGHSDEESVSLQNTVQDPLVTVL